MFLKTAGATAGALTVASSLPVWAVAKDAAPATPESLVKQLYDTMTPEQRKQVCHAWDYQDKNRGLLRTFVANNWNINDKEILGDFYTDDQRDLIRAVFNGIIRPEWHTRFEKQLEDDAGGFGNNQSIAIFGEPGSGKFEFVMTGRHMTVRCDGDSADHVAFGGPIFYGHAVQDEEEAKHPGNVFWEQGVEANKVFEMLDGKQRAKALVENRPDEADVGFRGPSAELPGIRASDMSKDQQEQLQKTLLKLVEPYRQTDQAEAMACLKAQGGLEKCSLAFYRDGDIGEDGVWDNWRLEGPSFVWYFRGEPHVHVWVNVASDPSVELNAYPRASSVLQHSWGVEASGPAHRPRLPRLFSLSGRAWLAEENCCNPRNLPALPA
jgi:hypothetical protein